MRNEEVLKLFLTDYVRKNGGFIRVVVGKGVSGKGLVFDCEVSPSFGRWFLRLLSGEDRSGELVIRTDRGEWVFRRLKEVGRG